ncbi:MAG: hypothetical protein KF784_15345 [Fimbriimonadaceae bacterium]|nr:hypothetical protein [Fimbriimonadaceae bacterium]
MISLVICTIICSRVDEKSPTVKADTAVIAKVEKNGSILVRKNLFDADKWTINPEPDEVRLKGEKVFKSVTLWENSDFSTALVWANEMYDYKLWILNTKTFAVKGPISYRMTAKNPKWLSNTEFEIEEPVSMISRQAVVSTGEVRRDGTVQWRKTERMGGNSSSTGVKDKSLPMALVKKHDLVGTVGEGLVSPDFREHMIGEKRGPWIVTDSDRTVIIRGLRRVDYSAGSTRLFVFKKNDNYLLHEFGVVSSIDEMKLSKNWFVIRRRQLGGAKLDVLSLRSLTLMWHLDADDVIFLDE